MCRTITRPAISNERLSVNRAGQLVLKLKTAWRDGTSQHVMTPTALTPARIGAHALGEIFEAAN